MPVNQTKILITTQSRSKIGRSEFSVLCNSYAKLLKNNPFPKTDKTDYWSHLTFYKRALFSIGPYQNITVFEAANRIATDLVLLNGIKTILESEKLTDASITIRLGNEYIKGKGDFDINNIHGEAFNVAPSFFPEKLRKTLKNINAREIGYIVFNEDALNSKSNLGLYHSNISKIECSNVTYIAVKNWKTI
ncbi:MAG: hypothetical protein K0S33_4130 [Bacteroidetes bacterium]|jgi:hypothetical protein|nr:hypothetical protein [Bacteroidota bacterium]